MTCRHRGDAALRPRLLRRARRRGPVRVVYQKPQSEVDCEYVWRQTDLWIDFPWSAP